ncbi:MAG: redoxin family protein [Phycisphaerales bacterium]|nr:redoxin family protein [Phycisphaerales bacterium]MCB9857073.1 redoxin family protein [Phycisphaerales bacterium]MCB9861800.1 redoxin family protein [Phycisphaerales bacterium]
MSQIPFVMAFMSRFHAIVVPVLIAFAQPLFAEEPPPPLQLTTQVQDGDKLNVGRQSPDLAFETIRGKSLSTSKLLEGKKGLVYVMTSTGCPLSKKYGSRIATIEKQYADRVPFVYVNTVQAETLDDMRRQIREYGFGGPYLPDRQRSVSDALGARTTTEVFVIDAARTVVYRGAVDDQYGIGAALSAPRRNFLRDAIEAVLAGARPRIEATFPPGCLLDAPKGGEHPDRDLTYYGRIARILAENCTSCHRPGGTAPFPLTTYPSLTGRVSMIDAVVSADIMPPWHGAKPAEGKESLFANDRSLSKRDRDDLLAWLRSSRPIGRSADAPVAPAIPNTWDIGRPDEVYTTLWLELPEEGPMQHARMIVPTNLKRDRWVSSYEFRYDMHEAIHHALIWVLPPGAVVPPIDRIPSDLELLGAYSPSDNVVRLDEGVARKLPAGSILLVDLYARPMGQELRTRLRIGVRFADAPPKREIRTLVVSSNELDISADDARATRRIEATLTGPVHLAALMPYLRSRGEAVTIDVEFPDGTMNRLLDAPAYDYRWQIRYVLKEPIDLPEGTRFIVTGTFDNGASNPNNQSPGESATSGVDANDEALMMVLEVLDDVGSE